MALVTRLRLLTGLLGISAVSIVIGTTVFGDVRGEKKTAAVKPNAAIEAAAELARTRFTDQPALTYRTPAGQTLFAWQVKPVLAASAPRAKDVVILVDTSASQAGKPLQSAKQIITAMSKSAGADDRYDVWTVNFNDDKATRSLTRGFKPASDDAVKTAASRLTDTEYAAGATDLKAGLEKATAGFENKPGRQQIVLLLGDGDSAASPAPITEATRLEIAARLGRNEVQFFAIPLGLKVNSYNLHGLATMTGGAVIRLGGTTTDAAQTIAKSFDVPVLRTEKFAFGEGVVESFPSKLPPLRSDRSTLVLGSVKDGTTDISLSVSGTVHGVARELTLTQSLPAADADHAFLNAMTEQWRTASTKDAPAILPADRALSMAAEQFRLYRDEYLSQAVYAVSTNRIDHAEQLYKVAGKIDPTNPEVLAGLKVVNQIRDGKLNQSQIRAKLSAPTTGTTVKNGVTTRMDVTTLVQDAPKQPAPAAPTAPGAAANNLVAEAQAKRQIQEQQFKVLVEDTIRKARQLLQADPDAAYEDLKRQRESVLANDQIGDSARRDLALQIESQMRDVQTRGAGIKKAIAEQRERIARARYQMAETARQTTQEEQVQSRIDAFKQLMHQARFELAQQEAELMRQERIARGLTVPPEVLTSYYIGQYATNLREHKELIRLREDRTLLTLMQVEKSFMPYPDEPPVHFPPAAVWRELTANRKTKYSAESIGPDVPQSLRDLKNTLENGRVRFDQDLSTLPLGQITDQLEKQFGITFVYLEDELVNGANLANPRDQQPKLKQKLNGLPLRNFLDILLPNVNKDLTYIVRPEYIELTTVNRRLEEKVTTAFAVADLVIPIPQSVNQQSLQQGLQFQNAQLAIFGQALGQANFLGSLNGGALGIGGIGGGIGGGLGGGIGGAGLGAAGAMGGAGGFGGAAGLGQQGGGGNQGIGGGAFGTTGGQLGQFGNLGGQFGIQGGDQSAILLALIIDTVARGEWSRPSVSQPGAPMNPNGDDESLQILSPYQLNSIGYYPPARALIVRGTGLYHNQTSIKLKSGAPGGGAKGGQGLPGRGDFAAAPAKPDGDRVVNPKEDPKMLAKSIVRNPRTMWQEALEKIPVNDPGVIVACADFLMQKEAFAPGHAAELLKASLRTGSATDTWTHEALAVAMTLAQEDPSEIQRAELSALDVDSSNPKSLLRAANSASQHGKYDLALAYCQQAAALEPNTPAAYVNALSFATKSDAVTTDVVEWAAVGVFARDWANEGVNVHGEAKAKLEEITRKFNAAGRQADLDRITGALAREKQRDLVIEVLYQGRAVDLDLSVTEPNGAICSPTRKISSGGGIISGDILEQDNDRAELYTAALAFDGTYTATVTPVIGRAIGGTATIKVTKFAGSDRQKIETYTVDATKPSSVTISLKGGSRTELAKVPMGVSGTRLETTAKPTDRATGVGAGFGMAGTNLLGANTSNESVNLAPVVTDAEQNFVSTTGAPTIRAQGKVTADRKGIKVNFAPDFSNRAMEIPMPKVPLMPGAGE